MATIKFTFIVKALFSLSVVFSCFSQQVIGADTPTVQPDLPKVRSVELYDKQLAVISEGDFVHPRFSPDGTQLIYADVLVRDGVEGTSVYLMDLKSKSVRTLLGAEDADKYSVYKVFVTNIQWLDNTRVEVMLSDGDVGTTEMIFKVTDDAITHLSTRELDTEVLIDTPAELVSLRDKILAAFTGWDADVLNDALLHNPIAVPGRGMILQKNYAGHDQDVWFLDIVNKQQHRLLEMSEQDNLALGGGVVVGDEVLFAVTHGSQTFIYRYASKTPPRVLAKFANQQWRPFIEVRFVSSTEALFILKLHESYEQGHNPVLYFSRQTGLVEVSDCANCYDFDAAKQGQLAVFSRWVSGRRQLQVMERIKH